MSWLREQDGITGARINYDCASLIIEYDPVHADAMQRMLDRLSSLSLDDWEVFLGLPPQAKEIGAPGSGPDAAWPVKRPDPHPGVLVLPTVSLASGTSEARPWRSIRTALGMQPIRRISIECERRQDGLRLGSQQCR